MTFNVLDEITYLRIRWNLRIYLSFHPTIYIWCNYLSMFGFKFNHVSKRCMPWKEAIFPRPLILMVCLCLSKLFVNKTYLKYKCGLLLVKIIGRIKLNTQCKFKGVIIWCPENNTGIYHVSCHWIRSLQKLWLKNCIAFHSVFLKWLFLIFYEIWYNCIAFHSVFLKWLLLIFYEIWYIWCIETEWSTT